MKIDETQIFYALYSKHTWSVIALFDTEESAKKYITLCDHQEKLVIERVTMSHLIRSYQTWYNAERRYA